jgi:hypothetical protein
MYVGTPEHLVATSTGAHDAEYVYTQLRPTHVRHAVHMAPTPYGYYNYLRPHAAPQKPAAEAAP